MPREGRGGGGGGGGVVCSRPPTLTPSTPLPTSAGASRDEAWPDCTNQSRTLCAADGLTEDCLTGEVLAGEPTTGELIAGCCRAAEAGDGGAKSSRSPKYSAVGVYPPGVLGCALATAAAALTAASSTGAFGLGAVIVSLLAEEAPAVVIASLSCP